MGAPRRAPSWLSATLGGCLLVAAACSGSQPDPASPLAKASGPAWRVTGSLFERRTWASMTVLPSGKVLIAGGHQMDHNCLGVGTALSTAELYDPDTGVWSPTGSMLETRESHDAVLLGNGRVLVVGGWRMAPDGTSAPSTTAEIYDPATETWSAVESPAFSHLNSPAVRLPSGRVLVLGGDETGSRCEVYDPATNTWSETGPLVTPRTYPTATLLGSGKVLVVGGYRSVDPYGVATEVELYDPTTGRWSRTGSIDYQPVAHTATLLGTGEVLVNGGAGPGQGAYAYSGTPLAQARLYDPVSGTWRPTGSMNQGRYGHVSVLLASGRVLSASGIPEGRLAGHQVYGFDAVSGEIYDPVTGSWVFTPPMERFVTTGMAAAMLSDGDVLVAGGIIWTAASWEFGYSLGGCELLQEVPREPDTQGRTQSIGGTISGLDAVGLVLATAGQPELHVGPGQDRFRFAKPVPRGTAYDVEVTTQPEGESCTVAHGAGAVGTTDVDGVAVHCSTVTAGRFAATGRMAVARQYHTATLLSDGRVLVAGGWDDYAATDTAELYDPITGRFSPTGRMTTPRAGHTATLLPGGEVLLTGGTPGLADRRTDCIGGCPESSAELFDPVAGTFRATGGAMSFGRIYHTATLLEDGTVLVVGHRLYQGSCIYVPGSDAFVDQVDAFAVRAAATATLLPDGTVLVAGAGSAERYEPDEHTFHLEPFPMVEERWFHAAALLPGGNVLLAGGATWGVMGMAGRSFEATAETYDAVDGRFAPTGSMAVARAGHTATPLPRGGVLVAGGYHGHVESSAEVYDVSCRCFTAMGAMLEPRWNHTATLLPDGLVLVVGGTASGSRSTRSAEIYHP